MKLLSSYFQEETWIYVPLLSFCSSESDSNSDDNLDLSEKSKQKNGLLSARYKDSFTAEGMYYCINYCM